MFISHKSNVIQAIDNTEWNCRRKTKGLTKPEYWAWFETIKDSDGEPDYSDETDYTIVECTDENVFSRIGQLSDYVVYSTDQPKSYNIKYYVSKRDAEEI